MIGNFKVYTAMKDSGVPLLGKVPEHWNIKSIGQLGYLFKANGGSKEDEVLKGVPCVRYGDLYTQHEFFIRESRSFVSFGNVENYTDIQYGDLLFAASGETFEDIGRSSVNLLRTDACCGGDILVLRSRQKISAEFLGYTADSQNAKDQKTRMGQGFTIVHIYQNKLKYLVLPIPSYGEQLSIVRYLNYIDHRIQRYINVKKKLIKLLEEQRQAIINQAVTKGIDPNVKMKPSGIEWLGEIPEHWEVHRSKTLFKLRVEKSGSNHGKELLSIYTHIGVRPRKTLEEKGNKASSTDDYWNVEVGDLISNKLLAWMGAIGVSEYMGVTSPAYDILRPLKNVNSRYYHYLYRTSLYKQIFRQYSRGIMDMRLRLYYDRFGQIRVPLPSYLEQQEIILGIEGRVFSITEKIRKTASLIKLVQEYRTRLTSDVVTGKIDVRDIASKLPDEPDEDFPELDDRLDEAIEELENNEELKV